MHNSCQVENVISFPEKAEKEERERQNQPKFKSEKEIEMDQQKAIEKARQKEESGQFKQCNGM